MSGLEPEDLIPETQKPIVLGCTVLDRASLLKGVVISKLDELSGNVRWGVQPPGQGVEMPESYFIDHHMLQFIDDGVSKHAPAVASTDTIIKLGFAVKDSISGFTGIAKERITYLNGCIRYFVQPKTTKKSSPFPDGVAIDHLQLRKTGPGVMTLKEFKEKPPVKKTTTKKPPGGPSSSTRMKTG